MEYLYILIYFPISALFLGFLEQFLLSNVYALAIVNLLLWGGISYVTFNGEWTIWPIIYAVLSTIAARHTYRKFNGKG